MKRELDQLAKGEITFCKFSRLTAPNWERLARSLMRRWECPAGVELADVVQELLVAAWRSVGKFDPTRGVPLQAYVVFNSMDKAKKWMHKQRSAGAGGDKAKGRFARPLSLVSWEARTGENICHGGPAPSAQQMLETREMMQELTRTVAQQVGPTERYWVFMLQECGWDPQETAKEMFCDPRARELLGLGSIAQSREQLVRVVQKVGRIREIPVLEGLVA